MVLQTPAGLRLPEQLPQFPPRAHLAPFPESLWGKRWQAAPQEGPVRSHHLPAKCPQHSRQLRSVRANTSSQNFLLWPTSHHLHSLLSSPIIWGATVLLFCVAHTIVFLNKQIKMAESRHPRKRIKPRQACDGNFHRMLHSLNKTAALDLGALSFYFCHEYI